MNLYAHTDPANPGDPSKWEQLFTPFGEGIGECRRRECQSCKEMDPGHGHLNKVAYWCGTFASEMFPPGPDREAAWEWGYLAGLQAA